MAAERLPSRQPRDIDFALLLTRALPRLLQLHPERPGQTVEPSQNMVPQELLTDWTKLAELVDHPDATSPPKNLTTYKKLGIDLAGAPISPEDHADRRALRRVKYGVVLGIVACTLAVGGAVAGGAGSHAPSPSTHCTTASYYSVKGPVGVELCPAAAPSAPQPSP